MSLGDMTWLKAIVTTLGIVAYGVVVCLTIGFYFARQGDSEKKQHDAEHEGVAKATVPAT